MKNVLLAVLSLLGLASCSSLHSVTTIKPHNQFVLGDNPHGAFKVRLRNSSNQPVQVYLVPIDGGKHSPKLVPPQASSTIRIPKNTAITLENRSNDTVAVRLKVTGDTGLSMKYRQ